MSKSFNFKIQNKAKEREMITQALPQPPNFSSTIAPIPNTVEVRIRDTQGFAISIDNFETFLDYIDGSRAVLPSSFNDVTLYYTGTATLERIVSKPADDVHTNLKVSEYNVAERLEEALDDGLAIVRFSTLNLPFKMFNSFVSTIDGKTRKMSILSDFVGIDSKEPPLYEHTIKLVELTKTLERIMCDSLGFTQPIDLEETRYTLFDFFERVRRTQPLRAINNEYTPFLIPTSLENELKEIALPQMFINKRNMREMLNEGAKIIDGISRLENNFDLSITRFNELKDFIEEKQYIADYNSKQDTTFYSTDSESYIENAVFEGEIRGNIVNFPANGYVTPRSSQFQLRDDFLIIKFPEKIEEITGAYTFLRVSGGGNTVIEEFDISSFIYEYDSWLTLPGGTPSDLVPRTRQNTLYYRRKSDLIENIGTGFGAIWSVPVITSLLGRAIQEKGYTWVITAYPDLSDSFNIPFRFEYEPYHKSRITIERQRSDFIDKKATININQEEPLVNSKNFLDNTYGKLQRLGNAEISFSQKLQTEAQAYKKGDYDVNGYIITIVEFVHFPDFVVARYQATLDFNRIAKRIGTNMEFRSTEIGVQTLDRNLKYNQYIELTDVSSGSQTTFLTTIADQVFMNTFRFSGLTYFSTYKNRSPKIAFLESDEFELDEISGVFSDGIGVPLTTYAGGNSLVFYWRMQDNLIAYNRQASYQGARENRAVKYKKEDGTLDSFKMSFHDKLNETIPTIDSEIDDIIRIGHAFPILENPLTRHSIDPVLTTPYFDVLADTSEILSFTYQIHVISQSDKFVVGEQMLVMNNLIQDFDDYKPTLFVYSSSTEKYSRSDNKKCKGSIIIGSFTASPALFVALDATAISNLGSASWAIGDIDGNLYVACNDVSQTIIYFRKRDKRSDIDYDL